MAKEAINYCFIQLLMQMRKNKLKIMTHELKLLIGISHKVCSKSLIFPWTTNSYNKRTTFSGGYEEFTLIERLGEGNRPAVVIGELADDLGLDLVVLSMETIHSKHVDANLLAEFVPCPVFLVPLWKNGDNLGT